MNRFQDGTGRLTSPTLAPRRERDELPAAGASAGSALASGAELVLAQNVLENHEEDEETSSVVAATGVAAAAAAAADDDDDDRAAAPPVSLCHHHRDTATTTAAAAPPIVNSVVRDHAN
jgi:hypothetical protein